jgi:hypothetical protein
MNRVLCPVLRQGGCTKVEACPHKKPHVRHYGSCDMGRCSYATTTDHMVGACVQITEEEAIAYAL